MTRSLAYIFIMASLLVLLMPLRTSAVVCIANVACDASGSCNPKNVGCTCPSGQTGSCSNAPVLCGNWCRDEACVCDPTQSPPPTPTPTGGGGGGGGGGGSPTPTPTPPVGGGGDPKWGDIAIYVNQTIPGASVPGASWILNSPKTGAIQGFGDGPGLAGTYGPVGAKSYFTMRAGAVVGYTIVSVNGVPGSTGTCQIPANGTCAFSLLYAPSNGSTCVGNTIPATMSPNHTYSASVTFMNSGTTVWDKTSYNMQLTTQGPTNPISPIGKALVASVSPGGQVTIPINVTAPALAGTYDGSYKMYQSGIPFGAACGPQITVVDNTPAPTPVVFTTPSDYCLSSGTAGQDKVTWTYTDPDNVPPGTDPQSGYMVRIVDNATSTVLATTGHVTSSDQFYYIPHNPVLFGRVLYGILNIYDTSNLKISADSRFPATTWRTQTHLWPAPTFSFAATDPSNKTFSFDASTSTCYSAPNIVVSCPAGGYNWDFGDGTTGSGSAVSHTYAAVGLYNVKLTLTDALGAVCPVTNQIGSTPSPTPLIPTYREVVPGQ